MVVGTPQLHMAPKEGQMVEDLLEDTVEDHKQEAKKRQADQRLALWFYEFCLL